MEQGPEYRAMLAVDIKGSGGRGDTAQRRIRETLFAAVTQAVRLTGIDPDACHVRDSGDAARVIVPPSVPKYRLVAPLLTELAAHLRAANDLASPLATVRVRAALHAGDVYLDDGGVRPAGRGGAAGRTLEVLARLLDAAPVRQALAQAPPSVTVAAIMSQHFYEETVPHGYPGIVPGAFRKVRVTEKEYDADAWLFVPGSPVPPAAPGPGSAGQHPAAAPGTAGPAGGQYTMTNTASGSGVINAVQGGDMHVGLPARPGRPAPDHAP